MKRWIALTAGLLLAAAAHADSVRFGSQVITDGMSEGKVYQIAGEPTRRVQLQNRYGAALGYRLEYDLGRKIVTIVVSGGYVQSIQETN